MKMAWSLVLLVAPPLALADSPPAGPLGKAIPGFKLRDYRGAERSLDEFRNRRLVVVAFLGTECPLARLYGTRLAELARQYEPRGIAFLGISSNQQDSLSAIGQYAKQSGITFPILKDVGNVLADRVAVVDHGRVIAEGTPQELKVATGGARLELTLSAPSDGVPAALAPFVDGAVTVSHDGRRVRAPVRAVSGLASAVVRAFDAAGISVDDVEVRAPSLDDVFFALTGHGAANDERVSA